MPVAVGAGSEVAVERSPNLAGVGSVVPETRVVRELRLQGLSSRGVGSLESYMFW